jgi:hypothetical protein
MSFSCRFLSLSTRGIFSLSSPRPSACVRLAFITLYGALSLRACSKYAQAPSRAAVTRLNLSTWGAKSYFDLYMGLRRWEPYLGWWISTDGNMSVPLRFNLEVQSGRIVKPYFRFVQDFNDGLPLVPGSWAACSRGGTHLVVDGIHIAVQDIGYFFTTRLSLDWRAATSQMEGRLLPPSADYW